MKPRFILTGLIATALATAAQPVLAASFNITSGTTTSGQTLNAGQTGVVGPNGTLSVAGSTVAITVAGSSTITNDGQIKQTGTGRGVRNATGTVTLGITNNVGALIQTADADTLRMEVAGSNVTLDNYGSIISVNPSKAGSQAIDWNGITTGSNAVRNYSTGLIQTTAADSIRPGANGTVTNTGGTITAIPVLDTDPTLVNAGISQATSSDGIDAQTLSGIQVTNSGNISGRHGITGGAASAVSNFAISVTNNTGGVISGVNGSGLNIDNFSSGGVPVLTSSATIINNGTIMGSFDSAQYNTGDGDGVDVDGTVNLTNSGIIRGIGAGGNGSDGGGNNAEGVSIGGGTVTNNLGAEITGENTTGTGAEGHGILVDNSSAGNAFAATTVTNSGLVRGKSGYGIKMIGTWNDTVTNSATGTIRGAGNGAAIQTGGGQDTLTNRGTITGDNGSAIDLEAGDDLLKIEGGSAQIAGNVSGGSGNNTATLDPGTGGSFSYGGSLSNFSTVEVKSGTVALSGVNAFTGSTKLSGGLLRLEGANRLNASSTLLLNGGTLEISAGAVADGLTLGSLTLSDSSALDLDSTSVTFNGFGGYTPGETLTILDYSSAVSPAYALRFLGDLTADASFLALANATTINGQGTGLQYDGTYTNVIAAVPEPSTVLVGLALLGVAGLRDRRRRKA